MSAINVISTTQRIVVNEPSAAVAVLSGPDLGAVGWELYSEYTTPGTYNGVSLPDDTLMAEFVVIGPGSGGGSGRRGLSTEIRTGGSGGAPGVAIVMPIRGSAVHQTFNIVVTAGGAGGAVVAADNTNGNSSTVPTATTVTGSDSGLIVYAYSPTAAGGGALGASSVAGSGRPGVEGYGFDGVASSAAGGAGTNNPLHTNRTPSGGGAGAGMTAANAVSVGGVSAGVLSRNQFGNGGAAGAVGAAGWSPTAAQREAGALGGSGGGGGGSFASSAGKAGGAGGYPGGGGGGGSASQNGFASGAGGKGGDGYVGIWILRQLTT